MNIEVEIGSTAVMEAELKEPERLSAQLNAQVHVGMPGAAATVAVGTVTTGEPGTDAQVTNSGTENAAVLDFTIPRGANGADGKDGASGEGVPAVTTAGTANAFTATVSGITELKAGLMLSIIPHIASGAGAVTLDVNGLGAYPVKLPKSGATGTTLDGGASGWLALGEPVLLMFDGACWIAQGLTCPDMALASGTLPVSHGGTGLTELTKGRYLVGNGTGEVSLKTPAQVLGNIMPDGPDIGQTLKYGEEDGWTAANERRSCRRVVGTTSGGWGWDDCDILCLEDTDEDGIAEAAAECVNFGGEVRLLSGTYYITTKLALSELGGALKIVGEDGAHIVIGVGDDGTCGIVLGEGQSIEGVRFSLAENTAPPQECIIDIVGDNAAVRNCVFEMPETGQCKAVQCSDGARIEGCRFEGFTQTAVSLSSVNNCFVSGCRFVNSSADPDGALIKLESANGCIISGNMQEIDSSGPKGLAVVGGGVDLCSFCGNVGVIEGFGEGSCAFAGNVPDAGIV